MQVCIVIPIYNEATRLPDLLDHLALEIDSDCSVWLCDGGSTDGSQTTASDWLARWRDRPHVGAIHFLAAPKGRASQMNAGAAASAQPNAKPSDVLLFLHADTILPADAIARVRGAVAGSKHAWGRFDVRIAGRARMLTCVAWMMNQRSRWSGVCTGDQTLFMHRALFEQTGGFPQMALMEDIALSKRLRALTWPIALTDKVTTSGRRWETRGVWRTIVLMWALRLGYWLGMSPESLARAYR